MQLIYEHTFNGHIWRLIPDQTLPVLIIEEREEKKKEVSFFALFLEKNLILSQILTQNDGLNWWTGVSGLGFGKIFFHKFLQPDTPVPSGIFCYDITTGKKIWENQHFLLNRIQNHSLLVINDLSLNGETLLELHSGEIFLENQAGESSGDFENDSKIWILPVNYKEESDHFQTISKFICIKTGLDAVKQIEYIESKTLIIVCFYTFIKELHLQHHLYVWDPGNGELLHTDILKEQVKGVGLDNMMLLDGRLVYIKNVNILKIYEN